LSIATNSIKKEDRWQTMGFFDEVLFVVYTERKDSNARVSGTQIW